MGRIRSYTKSPPNPLQVGRLKRRVILLRPSPPKRQKTLLPKGDKGNGKATGVSKEKGQAPTAEDSEYEITRRDTGVVFCSDQAFSDLSPKELKVCWKRAMG